MTKNCVIEPSSDIEPVLGDATTMSLHRIHPRTLSQYGILLGTAMLLVAIGWTFVWRNGDLADWFPARYWWAEVALGGGVGLAFALVAGCLIDYVPELKHIEHLLMHTLDMEAFRPAHAVWFGLLAGIPEEILFRGAMQPVLGLVVTSIVFGALHAMTRMYFLYALVAGLMLGVLARWTDGLWTPITAHIVIDMVMFYLLIVRWRHYHLPAR